MKIGYGWVSTRAQSPDASPSGLAWSSPITSLCVPPGLLCR
jgi:hypothetical protein